MITLPLLPLRAALVQPGAIAPLNIGRPGSVAACERARRADGRVICLAQQDPDVLEPRGEDLYEYGIIAEIVDWEMVAQGRYRAHLAGEAVVQVLSLDTRGPAWVARGLPLLGHAEDVPTRRLAEALLSALRHGDLPSEVLTAIPQLSAVSLTGFASVQVVDMLEPEELQELLEAPLVERVDRLTRVWEAIAIAARAAGAAGEGLQPPDPVEDDPLGPIPEDDEALAWVVDMHARIGGIDRDGLVQRVIAEAELVWGDSETPEPGHDPESLRDRVIELAHRAHASRREAAEGWPEPTDAEKLRTVLQGLDSDGIAWGWTDCHDLEDVIGGWEREPGDPPVRGAVWLTPQDTEDAVRGAGVRLSFAPTRTEVTPAEIAREAVAAIEEAGLPVWWPGRADIKIHVPIRWRVRVE